MRGLRADQMLEMTGIGDEAAIANNSVVRTAFVLVLSGLALALPASASARVSVWFEKGGQPVSVARGGSTIEGAVLALLAGPTVAERARGLRSAVPARTPLRGLTIERRIVTVDLGSRFAAGRGEASLRSRVGQLVRTVRNVPGVRAVRVLVEGGVPVGLFPGYDLRRPVGAAVDDGTVRSPSARELRQALVDLGFMAPSGLSGADAAQVATAVLGFQKWVGLPRDGVLGPATVSALERTARPQPARRAPGRRIEVQVGRQLALLVENDKVIRSVHISSGAGGATPIGSFRVFRKERYSWSVPFKVWLPWASYFTGGVAFHEFGSVPTYAASHGCVRVNRYDAPLLYEFASPGTPVDVLYERA